MIVREARLEDAPAIARVHVDTWAHSISWDCARESLGVVVL